MNLGRTVFAQLISFLPDREFRRCVSRYDGDRRWRGFSCWDQFLGMAFAQLSYRESLRDIEACLRSLGAKLYHMGFRSQVARSTLADANESRDWRIYADFAQVLIRIARPLYARDPIGVDLDQSLYALDSTTIDLCLSLFPWARFRRRKAAVKMHTLLDLRGNIPTFIRITDGKTHDVNILDEFLPEPGAFYVMDRAYVDFQRLFVFTLCSSFFVVRTKKNILLQRRYSHPVDKSTGLRSDQTVILTAIESAQACPDSLRRVSYFDRVIRCAGTSRKMPSGRSRRRRCSRRSSNRLAAAELLPGSNCLNHTNRVTLASTVSSSRFSSSQRSPGGIRSAMRASIRRSASTSASAQNRSIVVVAGRIVRVRRHASTNLRTRSSFDRARCASSRSRSPSSRAARPEKDRNPYSRRSSARCSCRVSDRTA